MTRGAGGSGHAHAPWHGLPLSQQASAPRLSRLSTLNARPAALWRCAHAAAALAALAAAPSAAVQKRASARGNAPARCADASRAAWPRQGELRRVLDSEKPRDPIDLRGRLDSKGVRYGKVIDFKMSELRVIELLDGLCEPMVNYALWTPSAQWITANPDADHERRWVRISGAGADVQGATDESLKGAKGKTMGKEMQSYCARLVEEHEEELASAVRAEDFNSNTTESLLCRRLSKACRGERLRKAPSPAAEPAAPKPADDAPKDEL